MSPVGHMSKGCPKPRDWSRVKCNNCGQSEFIISINCSLFSYRLIAGHTVKRCTQPTTEQSNSFESGGGGGGGGWGDDSNVQASGGWDDDSAVQPSGDWADGGADEAGGGGSDDWGDATVEAAGGW